MTQLGRWGVVLFVAWGLAGRAVAEEAGAARSEPRGQAAEQREAEQPQTEAPEAEEQESGERRDEEGWEDDWDEEDRDDDSRRGRGEPTFLFANVGVVPALSTNALFAPRAHNALSVTLFYDRIVRLTGLQLTPGMAAVEDSAVGLQLAGVASATGATLQGVQLGGLAAAAGAGSRGLQLGGLAAVSGGELRGVQGSLLVSAAGGGAEGLQLAGLVSASGAGMRGLQLAGLVSASGGPLWGLQAAALVSASGGTVRGGQLSGLVSAAGDLEGLQLGGLGSAAGAFRGLQLGLVGNGAGRGVGAQVAGIVNRSQRELTGGQLALVNVGARVHGVQVGLVNVAERMEGLQLGLVNVAERMEGVPIGLVSRVRGGPSALDVWAGELAPVSAAWRTGTHTVHSLLGAGAMLLEGVSPAVLAGVGVDVPLGARLTLSPDVVYQHAFRVRAPVGTAARLLQLRLVLAMGLGGNARGFVGVTANAAQFVTPAPAWLPVVAEVPLGERTVQLWPGAVVGVSL